jgi:hypothetical protein
MKPFKPISHDTKKRGSFICFLKGSSSDNDGDAVDARGCDTHTYTHTSVSLPSTPQAVPIGREKSYETGGGRETTTKMLNTPHWSPLATGSRNRFVSCMYHVPVRFAWLYVMRGTFAHLEILLESQRSKTHWARRNRVPKNPRHSLAARFKIETSRRITMQTISFFFVLHFSVWRNFSYCFIGKVILFFLL